MNVQFFYYNGKQIPFEIIDTGNYHGTLLPGCKAYQNASPTAVITVQEFQNLLVNIGHRLFEMFSKMKFSLKEPGGLRLEAVLNGETYISVNGAKRRFRAGEYRITDVSLFKLLFKKNTSCSLFISYYSTDLLEQLGISVTPCLPQRMPDMMINLINELLHNAYTSELRNFYYENCVRELLFFHLTQVTRSTPQELKDKDIDLVYKADALISSNLQEHLPIETLARMLNTNSLKLKLGFNKVYGMGVFSRLIFRRMEHAKLLLETTEKTINEIAGLTGYNSTAAFIHAFRKRFSLTPREWRLQQKKQNNEME